jgi:hypothetical protein
MTYTFEDATPAKLAGTGRKAEPNPFTDVIALIALKTDEKTGKPLAKSFIETHEDAEGKRTTAINRIKRLTSEAGEKNTPPVTVRVHTEPVMVKDGKGKETESPTQVRVTIWTVKRQIRPKTENGTAAK